MPFLLKTTNQKGVTLIELMLVVVLLGVITSFGLPTFQSYLLRQTLLTEAEELVSDLKTAQVKAKSSIQDEQGKTIVAYAVEPTGTASYSLYRAFGDGSDNTVVVSNTFSPGVEIQVWENPVYFRLPSGRVVDKDLVPISSPLTIQVGHMKLEKEAHLITVDQRGRVYRETIELSQ